jgi:hypothetical protein
MGGFTRNVTMYAVSIAACRVEPRYDIPASTCRLHALSSGEAIAVAVRWAAHDAGLPPWKPALREIARHATAVREIEEVKLSVR